MPSNGFDRDFDWQRQFIPEIKQVLADYLIAEAPDEEDQKHNTDLVVLKLDSIRVACRMRRSIGKNGRNYLREYPDEFTIRASRPSGAETELTKMLSGWGDYIFYGFATADESAVAAWMLGDLNVFRLWHHRELWAGRRPGIQKPNSDGSSQLVAYRIGELPQSFVVGRKHAEHEAAA